MSERSVAQEYYVLAVNEKGAFPALSREESKAGLIAAGVAELLLNGVIVLQKKKIIAAAKLPENMRYLASLYEFLENKVRTTENLMNVYLTSTGERLRRLAEEIGEELLEKHKAKKEKGGIFGNKTAYIPKEDYREKVIGLIKAAAADERELSSCDLILISLLKETKNLNRYLSDYERKKLRVKWKGIKENPGSKQMAEIIQYVKDMDTVMAASVITSLM